MADMDNVQLTLVVLRVSDLEVSRSFYEGIGLVMRAEQHGEGPRHLSAIAGPTVFELYPIGSGPSSKGTRIGWSVNDLDMVLAGRGDAIQERDGHRLAVLVDPDGHKVEITEHHSSIPDPAERMADACRRLFDVVANRESSLADLHRVLIGVLAAVQDVPAGQPTSLDAVADRPELVEASKVAAQNVAAIAGSSDAYWTVFNSELAKAAMDVEVGAFSSRSSPAPATPPWRRSLAGPAPSLV